eukprot:10944165-Ditylum_brightwellii.AAC.1
MSTVRSKIAHTHRNNHHRSITFLRIPESWPQIGEDINTVTDLENSKKAKVWRLIETLHKIAHYLKLCNRLYFRQARGTSFMISPLSIKVDWATNSIMSELILEGIYTRRSMHSQVNFLNISRKNKIV